jgi:hypothetical protein
MDAPMELADLERELDELRSRTRMRKSVDGFARAALEGFAWAVLAGVGGKLLWDSAQPPYFFYPLALLDLLLLWDSVRAYSQARKDLAREVEALRRLREVRAALGIDPPPAVSS